MREILMAMAGEMGIIGKREERREKLRSYLLVTVESRGRSDGYGYYDGYGGPQPLNPCQLVTNLLYSVPPCLRFLDLVALPPRLWIPDANQQRKSAVTAAGFLTGCIVHTEGSTNVILRGLLCNIEARFSTVPSVSRNNQQLALNSKISRKTNQTT